MLEVNSRNSRKRCEICSKLTVKIPERRQWLKAGWVLVISITNGDHEVVHTTKQSFPANYHATILSLLTYFDFDSVLSDIVWV